MKLRQSPLLSALLAGPLAALFTGHSAQAAGPYYWDNNGGTAGFGIAAGTWAVSTTGDASQGWSNNSAGGITPVDATTATTDAVNFGTATDGLGAGTITVSGTVDSGNITFGSASGSIVLSGGIINLAPTSTITVNNASDTISSKISGAGTTLRKEGSGIWGLVDGDHTWQFTESTGVLGLTVIPEPRAALLGGLGVLALLRRRRA